MSTGIKLHLGCGTRFLKGYINCDVLQYKHVDRLGDIAKLDEFKDNSVEEIYACHVLEHVGRANLFRTLKEWNRVLKIGGTLRIAVPDFEQCAKMYIKSPETLYTTLFGLLYGGQRDAYDFHNLCFDYSNLKQLLKDIGFEHVQRYNAHDFLPPGFDDFSLAYVPHKDFTNGTLMSLNVTAKKQIAAGEQMSPLFKLVLGKKLST